MVSSPSAFWDTSTLIPPFVQDKTSDFANLLVSTSARVIWWGNRVEAVSAIMRQHRLGHVDDANRQAALGRLEEIISDALQVQPIESVRTSAEEVLETYSLRAADAFQLAAALIWCQQRPAGRSLSHLTSD